MLSFQNQDTGGISKAVSEDDQYTISNVVDTKMLYLSTRSTQCQQLNGSMKSHVLFDLKSYLDFAGDDTIQTVTLAMPYAILCNSNYQIHSNNNTLNFLYNGAYTTIKLPYGNYSVDTFIPAFTLAMAHAGIPNFVLTYDATTSIFTLTNPTHQFTLFESSTMNYILGFSDDISSKELTAPFTITMPRVFNFLPNPLFRICIENNTLYNGQVLGTAGNPAYSNVLASIPNVTKQNTQIVYQNFADEFAMQLSGQTQLILAILDDNGDFVDFNGISSYFQLRIRIYRRVKRSLKTFKQVLGGATNLRNLIEESSETIEKPISKIL